VDEDAYEELARELVRTPAAWALVAIPLGAASAYLSIGDNPEGYDLVPGVSAVMIGWEYSLAIATQWILLAFAAHTIHQLRVVTRIHAQNVRVDLFRLDPLYAFASLTAWTGIAILATMVYGVGALYVVSSALYSIVDFALFLSFIALAIGSFLLPLLGLHARIQEAKDRHRAAAGEALATAIREVETHIAARDYSGMSELSDGVAAATSAVNTISRVSTWPWRPDTIRGFVGAIGLPVLIYAITAVISRFL
jgi:hypothetical protein